MADSDTSVYIVYTTVPADVEDHAKYHVETLAPIFGSEDAAKEEILYTYTAAATGYSAKLTPAQVSKISENPAVLQVVKSQPSLLHLSQHKLT
ncbi:hypothetical protein DM860_001415 [Cuscuta australis]|uniref:Inhibitor I9 domain-containing protein n=1 Tax=Cuscuta australis TaxID=267555 RepID=A0A328E8S4_9ASTE|nr:hypothetical protein DM860_001415 [Cuscuta australis]